MNTPKSNTLPEGLPVTRSLTASTLSSIVIALGMAAVSLTGIIMRDTVYPASVVDAQVGTDAINLAIQLPLILITIWLARRGSLIALLFWPGALLYVLYVYVAYLFGLPFNALFLPYVALVTLTAYTLIDLVSSIDGDAVQRQLANAASFRWAAGVLIGFAILFGAFQVYTIVSANISGATVEPLLLATGISDLAVQCPTMLIAGVMLWRRQALGFVAGAGLLLDMGVLFVGLPISGALASLLIGSPFNTDLIFVGVPGLLPLALLIPFVRGARTPAA